MSSARASGEAAPAEQPLAAPIMVVGIGADGPEGLSPRALALVERAEVLCGGERHLAFFPEHPARRVAIRANVETLLRRLRRLAVRKRVVVLASGDPLCFGIGARLVEAFGPERVRVLPHPSAAQLAFARLGLPWHDAVVLSAHGRELAPVVARALAVRTVAILTDPRHTPAVIARALLEAGMEPCQAYVLERLEHPDERITALRLDELEGREFDPLNVLVLRRERVWQPLSLGLPDDAYAHRAGMITKAEVRAVAISKLRVAAESVVWDIGAGCGSVALEVAGLILGGRVYAVERDPEQLALLEQNRQRHPRPNLEVVTGEAPAALRALPDPDAVFVGGSGGQLGTILRAVFRRLRPGGRLVLNAVLLETVSEAQRRCARAGWPTELCQVAVARGEPTAGGVRLAAANPVFILAAQRPERA